MESTGRSPLDRAPWAVDAAAAVALVVLIWRTHDLGTMVRPFYWLDEAWVALSVRLPLSDLPVATASTPIGWTLLLRLVPGRDHLRLLPLAFLVLAVLAAYALGRSLGWKSRRYGVLAGLAAAVATVFLPAAHVQHDLKQYTADAAVTLILLTLLSRVEASRLAGSRRWLAALAACSAVGMLLSHVTAIVAACAMAALVLAALARRDWRRLVESLVAGAVSGAAVLAIYFGVTVRGRTSTLEEYWAGYFPEPDTLWTYLGDHLATLQPDLGMAWGLLLALAGLGVAVLARTGRPATALAAALVPVVMVLLGLAKVYPLLDLRTSHFLLVLLAALAGLGAAGTGIALGRSAAALAGSRQWVAWAVAVVVVAAAAVGYGYPNRQWLERDPAAARAARSQQNVRGAVEYVLGHRAPGDVVVVDWSSSYGFAYYWTPDRPAIERTSRFALGWQPAGYPADARIVLAPDRSSTAIRAALARASELAGASGSAGTDGKPGRIWLIRSRQNGEERRNWARAAARYPIEARPLRDDILVVLAPQTA